MIFCQSESQDTCSVRWLLLCRENNTLEIKIFMQHTWIRWGYFLWCRKYKHGNSQIPSLWVTQPPCFSLTFIFSPYSCANLACGYQQSRYEVRALDRLYLLCSLFLFINDNLSLNGRAFGAILIGQMRCSQLSRSDLRAQNLFSLYPSINFFKLLNLRLAKLS